MGITTAKQAAEIINESAVALGWEKIINENGTADELEADFHKVTALGEDARSNLLKQAILVLVFRNYGTMFDSSKNPMRRFIRNDIDFGGGEEDIYHDIITPVTGFWAADFSDMENDSPESDALARKVAENLVRYYNYDVTKKFHAVKDTIDIPMSITEYELKQIFTPTAFARFIDVKMANLQWSAEYALLNHVIGNIRKMITDGNIIFKTGADLNSVNGVTSVVEYLRTATDSMKMLSKNFNFSGVTAVSDEDDLFLVTKPDFINRIQVRGYSNAFNVEYYRENNRLIVLPEGSDLGTHDGEPVHAVLIDRRAIVESIKYWAVKPFPVANTDYTNYFLKAKVLRGYNEFFNAVAITGDAIGAFDNTVNVGVAGGVGYDS